MKLPNPIIVKKILFLIYSALLIGVFNLQLNAETAANVANPGAEVVIKDYLRKGMVNIVDFYSEYCPPCRQISPLLEQLDRKRTDLRVVKLDINRKDIRGIDWQSPLIRQFQIQSIPHFKIYDENGNLKAEGEEAYFQILDMLKKEGITGS